MKRNRLTLTAVCMLACACVLPAQGADSLQQTLKGMWQGKEITLRTPDPASTISFDSNAVPIGDRKPGIWTDDSRFQVADVQVAGGTLRIAGRRVRYDFDPKQGKFANFATDRNVSVNVALPNVDANLEQVMPVLGKVFLTKTEALSDFAPSYWQTCLRGEITNRDGKWFCTADEAAEHALVNALPPGGIYPARSVSAPRVISDPDPDYTELAKKRHYQGAAVLRFVVNTEGKSERVRIISPIGMGLDQKAVEAIQRWTFKPATKDGQPVPVSVEVKINFRLY